MCLMMMELNDEVIKEKMWIVTLRELGDGYIKNIEKDLWMEVGRGWSDVSVNVHVSFELLAVCAVFLSWQRSVELMRSCWESGAAWNTMPYPAPGLGKLWAAHVHKEEGWLMEFLHKAKLPLRWMNTAPTQRRRSRTTTSIRAGSSLRMCICEYSWRGLCVCLPVRLQKCASELRWLLEEWVEDWKNWLVTLANRQNGYQISSTACLRNTAPSSPGDNSCCLRRRATDFGKLAPTMTNRVHFLKLVTLLISL